MTLQIYKRIIDRLLVKNTIWYKRQNILIKKMLFPIIGLTALIWFLIRVLPKPSRINYPCVRAAAPIATTFILYILGITTSLFTYRKAKSLYRNSRYISAVILTATSLFIGGFSYLQMTTNAQAKQSAVYEFNDPLGPNNPIGEAKGILPGRVVWVHNPDATNENCTNDNLKDAYFLDTNTNQAIVDSMFSEGILSLTGEETDVEAWDAIFKHFNFNNTKGDVGYDSSETVFIKINAVSAWSGIGNTGSLWRLPNESDTTPQTMLALLRQLIYKAGVKEENIYIGDPMAGIWNHIYDKLAAEFPDVKYVDVDGIVEGRTQLVESNVPAVRYSDRGTVLTANQFAGLHFLYESMMNADYILNIPVMKGHRWAGATLFAKNHFGSNTSGGSWHLHKGLMNGDDGLPVRTGYKKYRVLVDLMASQYLGKKTLLFFMDALWSTSYEHQKPQKFQTAPFNNDWSSSLLFSLDHVAIESVCLDILQKEFVVEDMDARPPRYNYVQWDGIDDYLHQAADSSWWPEGLIYDPDSSGNPVLSLGVHEHWNNADSMQYSGNLATGDGIELVKLFHPGSTTSVCEETANISKSLEVFDNFPNPFNPSTTIKFNIPKNGKVSLEIYNIHGDIVDILTNDYLSAGTHTYHWNSKGLSSGTYIYRLTTQLGSISNKMLLLK